MGIAFLISSFQIRLLCRLSAAEMATLLLEESDDEYIVDLRFEAIALKSMFDYFNKNLGNDLLISMKNELDFMDVFIPSYLMKFYDYKKTNNFD